jgi:hypothetical protein
VLGVVLAGCTSVKEQTQQPYDPTDGVSGSAGDIALRNVVIVANESGDAATLLASFANRGADADRLVEVLVGEERATPTGGSLMVPAGGYASLGPGAGRLDLAEADTEPGRFIEVEFVFRNAPRITVDALVQVNEGLYEDALVAPRSTSSP